MKKTIAMDIDGTILNKNSELDENVNAFFEDKRVKNSNLMFLTGNSYKIASALVKEITKKYPKYKGKKYYIATNNGATIYDLDGNLIHTRPMNKKYIKKIIKKLQKKYTPCDAALSTVDNNYVTIPKDQARAKEIEFMKDYQDKKGAMGWDITLMHEKTSKWINKIGAIYSLNIFTNNVDEVLADLKGFFNEKYLIHFDPMINVLQVTLSNKWDALQTILEYEHKLDPQSKYEKNASDVIYIGDGMNDIICMENCKKSYARGEKLIPDVKKSAKKCVVKLEEILEEIFQRR